MLVGLSAPVLIMAMAFGIELSGWAVTTLKLQGIADAAASAAAESYMRGATAQTAATYGAYLAEMNTASGAATRKWTQYTQTLTDNLITIQKTAGIVNSSDTAFIATIQASVPLLFTKIALPTWTNVTISATATAEIKASAGGACIIALGPSSTGVNLSGGTSVTASNCAVASNTSVTVPCGTSIVTKTVDYDSTAPSQGCNGIQPPSGTASVSIVDVATADPLASNPAVAAAFTHLASVATLTSPAGPTVPNGGTAITFGYGTPTIAQLNAIGCTNSSFSSPVWTVNCPPGGTYHFPAISLAGGITLNFATSGSSSNVYDFSGAINNSGSSATFGPGTFNIAGGIYTGGGTTTTFGAGTYNIGTGTTSCSGYSICHNGSTLTFGPGTFSIAGGINTGSTLSFGSGSTANSFTIGSGSAGYAINAGGSSITTFGGMASGTFQTVGKISTGGGSSLTLSAAPAHDLNGAISLAGSATLGAGTYTVAGNFALGAGGGGGTVTGSSVTIITSGSFSVGAGYSNVTLTAPSTGTLQDLVVASNASGGASFSEGASGNSISGAFYFPSGPIALSGAGSVGNGSGQCLELIGLNISLSGGSALASTCVGLAGGSSGVSTVVLAQ